LTWGCPPPSAYTLPCSASTARLPRASCMSASCGAHAGRCQRMRAGVSAHKRGPPSRSLHPASIVQESHMRAPAHMLNPYHDTFATLDAGDHWLYHSRTALATAHQPQRTQLQVSNEHANRLRTSRHAGAFVHKWAGPQHVELTASTKQRQRPHRADARMHPLRNM
jgi:hypothetical protein